MIRHYGENIRLSIQGASHAPAIEMTLEGIPQGLDVDFKKLQAFMDRRAPGHNQWSSSRKESDIPHFLSGITDGKTNGDHIQAFIYNQNVHRNDYQEIKHIPRPGHADYAAWMKYGLDFDMSGGGPFSGRMTAAICIAGGMCKQWLEALGIRIGAHIAWIGDIEDHKFDPIEPDLDAIATDFPVINRASGHQMLEKIKHVQENGDSIGGIVECAIVGMPTGIGGELFGGIEGKISFGMYSIPGVKGVDFGLGFANTYHNGSETNDQFYLENGKIRTQTNHCGGILGGISNGMPILFRVAIKPTPSIAKPQKSINLQTMAEVTLHIKGRHDPCIIPRAVPVVEAMAALTIYDMILEYSSARII